MKRYSPVIICEDAIEFTKSLADSSVDMVFTDPAYNSMEKHRARGTTTRLSKSDGSDNPWFKTVSNEYLHDLFGKMWFKLKPGRHLYVMANSDMMWQMKPMIESLQRPSKTPNSKPKPMYLFHKAIMWNKVAIGMGYHWRSQYEAVLFFSHAEAKDRMLNDLGMSDWRTYDVTGALDTVTIKRLKGKPPEVWPTEKPKQLCEDFILNASNPGEVVLDPFLGAGASTGVAAMENRRQIWGSEIDKKYWREAVNRVMKAKETP